MKKSLSASADRDFSVSVLLAPAHIPDHLDDLDDQSGQEGQQNDLSQVGDSESGSHHKQALQAGDKEHRQQQHHAGKEGHDGVLVGGELQAEDGLVAPAVEAVEQPGQGEGGEGHGGGQAASPPW